MNLPTNEELRESMLSAGLRILSETATPRRQRVVGGAAIVDSNTIIVAGLSAVASRS
jgi:flagellar biosynthesis regulator FlaF